MAADIFNKQFVNRGKWGQACMLTGVIPGTTVKKIQHISSKSAVAVSPACVAVLLPAMTDAAAPTVAEVRFAYTVSGILACKEWDWRSILGIDCKVDNPDVARSYRKLNMLTHPDKRTKLGIELAGGIDMCDQALQLIQQSYKDCWMNGKA